MEIIIYIVVGGIVVGALAIYVIRKMTKHTPGQG